MPVARAKPEAIKPPVFVAAMSQVWGEVLNATSNKGETSLLDLSHPAERSNSKRQEQL
jgi:hypothetical protein